MKKFLIETDQIPAAGIEKFCRFFGAETGSGGMEIRARKGSGNLTVISDGKEVQISYPTRGAFYHGLSFCLQNDGKRFALERKFEGVRLGILRDCARNAVLSERGAEDLSILAAALGYDSIGLNLEDLLEVEAYPYFGNLRGRYSREQIENVTATAELFGIEIVPCLQTLSDLPAAFKRDVFYEINDTDDVLLADDERTYAFLDAMIGTAAERFSSKRVQIGMRGAARMFRGKYLAAHGDADRAEVYVRHLARVTEICKKYGLEPCIWSDAVETFCRADRDFAKEFQERFPDLAVCFADAEGADDLEERTRAFSANRILAGDARTRTGFAPSSDLAEQTLLSAFGRFRRSGGGEFVVALWDGSECLSSCSAGTLLRLAEQARGGDCSEDAINERCVALFGNSHDEFLLLQRVNGAGGTSNRSSYLLYNDPLIGIMDAHATPDMEEEYARLGVSLSAAAEKRGKFEGTFEALAALCDVLKVKANLGNRIRSAYEIRDRATLAEIAEQTLPDLARKTKVFYETFRRAYLAENKSFGFEITQFRIGGLLFRLESSARTLKEYLSGKRERIDALERKRLPVFAESKVGKDVFFDRYREIVTGSVL